MRTSVGAEAAVAAIAPPPTPTTPEPSSPPPAGRLAESGMDASETLPLAIGAVALLLLGGVALGVVRVRARRT